MERELHTGPVAGEELEEDLLLEEQQVHLLPMPTFSVHEHLGVDPLVLRVVREHPVVSLKSARVKRADLAFHEFRGGARLGDFQCRGQGQQQTDGQSGRQLHAESGGVTAR